MEIDFGFTIGDVLRVKKGGVDLGDLETTQNRIAHDDVFAFETACKVYESQGIDTNSMKASEFREFLEGFRNALGDFFPLYQQVEALVQTEVEKAVAQANE